MRTSVPKSIRLRAKAVAEEAAKPAARRVVGVEIPIAPRGAQVVLTLTKKILLKVKMLRRDRMGRPT